MTALRRRPSRLKLLALAATFATVALAATPAFARYSKAEKIEQKKAACLSECDAVSDGALKKVCLATVQISKKSKGCWNEQFTRAQCCGDVAKRLNKFAETREKTCKGAAGCLKSAQACLDKLPSDPRADVSRCVRDTATTAGNAASTADRCATADANVKGLCKASVSFCVAKEGYRLEKCITDRLKRLQKVTKALAVCPYALDKAACESNWQKCHSWWAKKDQNYSSGMEGCLSEIAGAFGKMAIRLNSEANYDLRDGGDTFKNIDRQCQRVADDAKMSGAEKEAYAKLCDVKRKEVTERRALGRAENSVMYLVGNVNGHRDRLAKKAVLSMKANSLKFEAQSCLDSLALLQKGRKLADTAMIEVKVVYKKKQMSIADARKECQWLLDNVPVFAKAIKAENAKFAAKQIKEFCGSSKCKGKAQKKIINKLIKGDGVKVGVTNLTSAPGEVRKDGGGIVWEWMWGFDGALMCSCDRIQFNGNGSKVVKKYNARCRCRR